MTATKRMKVMLTATFLTMTACAGVDENNVPDPGDDTGSDVQPSEKVTIDSSDFVVDGEMWWTQSAAPRIHGTFEGPAGVTIKVKAGDLPAVTATLTDRDWIAQLANNSISSSNTKITVTLEAPSGAKVEIVQAIGLDGAPPAIIVLPSQVNDERGDQISFASGEPVHTHAGPEIDLAEDSCPSIYKYTYLMTATAPLYGGQTSPNDLAWHVKVLDAKRDPSTEQYRVRSDAGQTLIDWHALPAADATGVSTIKLDRTNVALLGTTAGEYFIDLRAKDQTMLSTTETVCFDFHPLQAPLQVMPMQKGELFDLKLSTDTAKLAGFVTDKFVPIATQKIIQRTAEKVHISWTPHVTASVRATSFGGWVTIRNDAEFYACPVGTTDPNCTNWTPSLNPGGLTTVTDNSPGDLSAFIVDDSNGETVAANPIDIDIPARPAGAAAQSYTLVVRERVPFMKPGSLTGFDPIGAQTLAGTPYIGQAPGYVGRACQQIVDGGELAGRICNRVVDYYNLTAVDHGVITYSDISATMKIGDEVPSYVAASAMKLTDLVWDSGDQDVPGSDY